VASPTHKSLLAESGRAWESIANFNLDQVVITEEPILVPYYVRSGDTLIKIAQAFYKDPDGWAEILQANREIIKTPNIIPVGLKINIPIILRDKEKSEYKQIINEPAANSAFTSN